METVIAVLMDDEKEDEQACADADGKTADVDSAVQAVTDKDSPGDGEIALKHVRCINKLSHSVRRLFAGGTRAARLARRLTVSAAINNASDPAPAKIPTVIFTR